MLYNILGFLKFLQSVVGFILMTSSVMFFREPKRKRIIMGILVMVLGISFLSYILFTKGLKSVDGFAVFVILAIQLSWFLICSKDPFFVSFFSYLSFANIYVFISYVSDSLSPHTSGTVFVIESFIIRTLIYIIILPLLFKFVRPRFRKLVNTLDKEWRAATLVPLMFLIVQSMVLYYPDPYWHWSNSWSRFVIASIYMLFVAVYYLLYVQATGIAEKYALKNEQLLMSQQEKLWESELARQKASTDIASRQKHDMRHHNQVIMELIQSGNINELKTYMEKFDSMLDKYSDNIFCSNPIANSIFNVYSSKAKKDGINIRFNVNIPRDIGIDNIDLTCILANSLENALEGSLLLDKEAQKEIIVTSKFIDNRLRVEVQNNCLANILFENDMPVTSKKGGGTGTKSIIYTAEKYDGAVSFSGIDKKFITRIVLNAK